MEQLLSIKHIPIKIEVNVTRPEFKAKKPEGDSPSVKISKQSDGGVTVAAQPYKIDLAEARYDSYTPSPVAASADSLTLTYGAVAKLPGGEEAAAALGNGQNSSQHIAAKGASRSIEAILNQLPKSKASKVSYNDGTLSINYRMDSGSSDEEFSLPDLSGGFEFIPGSIEFVISQMPDLEIEYTGDPIYFPRSADPNYKGEVDVIA